VNVRERWERRQARRRWVAETLILAALREQPGLSGWPLMERTGMSGGRVYATLARLERDGAVTSGWIDGPYPRRRLYRLAEIEETS
jgi:DNA-binding PadR family transcriptional regulator